MSWMDRRGMWGGVLGGVLREAGTLATQDDASTVSLVGFPCACLQSRSVMTHEFASSASRMCNSQCTPSNSCALGFRSVPPAGGCVVWRPAGRVRLMVRERNLGARCRAPRRLPNASGKVLVVLFLVDPSAYPNWTLLEPLRDPHIPDRDRFAETPKIHRVVSTLTNKSKCEATRHDRSLPCNTAATTKKPQGKNTQSRDQLNASKESIHKKHNSVKGKSNGKHSKDRQNEEANGTPSPSPAPPALALPPRLKNPPSETSRCVVCIHE